MNERLKERIAEEWAMLDPVDPLRSLLSDVIDALEQKPVGKWTGECIEWTDNPYKFNEGQPIYTTPPQRPWTGLTDDQLADLWYKESLDWMEFARAHEAALKEVLK